MRLMWALVTLTLTVTGCATAVSDSAVCAVHATYAPPHAAALARHGGDEAVTTGRRLIGRVDAACGF